MLSNKPAALHLIDCIAIDNTQVDPRLEELKKKIFELAKHQPHWGEEKPARWLPLEQAIMTLKVSGVKVAPLSLIGEINRSGSVKIEDRDELDLFLRFQHEMGTILYFSTEGLREKIVLDPQWMIDAQKSLITAGTFINKNPTIVSKWCEFKRSGKLTHELIDAVWSKEKNPELHDNKDHIILLMEKLNIIARPRTYDQDGEVVKVENYFLAPCMLNDTTPREIIFPKSQPERKNSSVLCYVFTEQFLPTPIFHRLLAACVTHWPIAKRKNSEFLIFCGCCVFQLNLHHTLTVFFREHVIFVRVTRTGSNGETPSTRLCIDVKEFISITLSNIIRNLEQSLRFELHIRCPKSEEYSVNSMIPVAYLQGNLDVPCFFHDNHLILSSEVLSFWFEEEGKEVSLQQQQEMERRESSVSKKDQYEEGQVDDSLNEDVNKDSATLTQESLLWSGMLRATVRKNEDGDKTLDVMGRDEKIKDITPETSTQMEQADKRDSVEVTGQTTSEECPKHLQRRALPPGKKYHAFFSYSSSDIQWVKQTIERLEKDHEFVCREYERDNTPGTPLLNFADDGIKHAYKTVIVMTREAFQSGFVLHEIQMAINMGFSERRNCVVPVLLEDCEVPGYLSVLNYVDARDTKKRNVWWPKLLMELEATG